MHPSASTLQIHGTDVFIEGDGTQTIVMVHGWPDTYRLWDGTVAALRGRYRCVRFTLPGFDLSQPARGTSVAEMVALFHVIVQAVCPGQALTLLLHDWGCAFGYEFAHRHPQCVARIVGVDIGDHNAPALRQSLTAKARWQVFGYQLWLAIAWKLGGALGNRMTRWMARAMRCPTAPAAIGWQMNYPYAMRWFGSAGGMGGLAQVQPHCPMLYIYGRRKLFMFHSPAWLQGLATSPGCAVVSLHAGHWLMLDQPAAFHDSITTWLEAGR